MSELRNDGGDDRLRAHVYGLLSRLLSGPPDADTLSLMSVVDARGADDDDSLAASWRDLQAAVAAVDPDGVGNEYFDLFVGLGRGELIPYASWYMSGFLMERPLVELRDDLAQLGFERREDVHEPEDHAAALCDVMALLHDAETGADDTTAAEFFQRHVGPWMSKLFQHMQTANAADFYRAVGRFGERFMEIETRYFATAPTATLPAAAAARFGSSRVRDVGAVPDAE
jgi:TorA maturation chaperone TorD